MEPTLNSAIIGSGQVYGVRELHSIENVATFNAGFADAVIDPTTLHFVNDANQAVRNLFAINPLEAPDFIPKTEGYSIVCDQKYAIDFRTLRIFSPVECEAQVFRISGAPTFEKNASGVSMQLLVDKGFLVDSDFRQVAYAMEDRKRIMAQVTLGIQLLAIQKSIFDEIFKMMNIAADLVTIGVLIAILNLIATWIQLALLIDKTIQLVIDNRELLCQPLRNHVGVNWYQYLKKGCDYLNVSLEMGDELKTLVSKITLLPSKADEVGLKTSIPVSTLDYVMGTTPLVGDGMLRPNDFGYTLGEAFALVKKTFNAKSAIKGATYHLRAKKDPYWIQSPAYTVPDVLVESSLNYENGYTEYNFNELVSRYLISYQKDETDYQTLTDTNNRMAEVIYDHPGTDRKKNLLTGLEDVEIPYALCVRKPAYDGIYSGVFKKVVDLINTFQDELQTIIDQFPVLNQVATTVLNNIGINNWLQEGALLVENHFFDQPKMVLLDPETNRIPTDYAKQIGADALWSNWHAFNCMASGWKSPTNQALTNQKRYFRSVRIPFGIKDWQKTIVNSQCNVIGYGAGEFLSIRWNTSEDHATCDFFVYENWAKQLTATLYKIKPVKEKIINFSLWG